MCLQTFLYFSCSHNTILTRLCNSGAMIADHVPFYMPHACEDYRIEHTQTSNACGARQFYSGDDHDGKHLDDIFQQHQLAHDRLVQVNLRLTHIMNNTMAVREHMLDAGMSEATIKQHPQYSQNHNEFEITYPIKQKLLRSIIAATEVLDEASKCYAGSTRGVPGMMSATGLLEGCPPPPAGFDIDQYSVTNEKHAHVSPVGQYIQVDASPIRRPDAKIEQVIPVDDQSKHKSLRHMSYAGLEPKRNSTPKLTRSRRRGREQQSKLESESEKSLSVRRSGRVQSKKVNYAERSSSSRSLSPEKSDTSAFSPTRSAMGDSSDHRPDSKQQSSPIRSKSSPGHRINDWNVRGLNERTLHSVPIAGPYLPSTLEHSPSRDNVSWSILKQPDNCHVEFMSTRDSRKRPPSGGALARSNFHFPVSGADWSTQMNGFGNQNLNIQGPPQYQATPSIDQSLSGNLARVGVNQGQTGSHHNLLPHNQRSSHWIHMPQQAPYELTTSHTYSTSDTPERPLPQPASANDGSYNDYNASRHSVTPSIPDFPLHTLLPAANDTGFTHTDPTKRFLERSSPLSSRRLRLSFPSEETNSSLLHDMMTSQASTFVGEIAGATQTNLDDNANQSTNTPAPFLIPTTVAYMTGDALQQQKETGISQYETELPERTPLPEQDGSSIPALPSFSESSWSLTEDDMAGFR